MIGSAAYKYAIRSLLRHGRRTGLSMLGVGIGCGIGLLAASWLGGGREMQIRAAAESGAGHLRVVPARWTKIRDSALRLTDWRRVDREINTLTAVRVAAPRSYTHALLACGNRTAGVRITGVVPENEMASNRIVRGGTLEGRYLAGEDRGHVVVGRVVAERLKVELDDDLYVTLSGREEIRGGMLRIVGILDTGVRELDSTFCQVTLPCFEELTGYPGVGEISILLSDYGLLAETKTRLEGKVGNGNRVITWREVNPGLAANVDGDRAFTRVIMAIIIVLVSLGIASAQCTSVLERRYELAVLTALGMRGSQVMGLVLLEAIVLAVGGAFIAIALGGTAAYWLATAGVDLSALMGERIAFEQVLLDPIIYGAFGTWIIWHALAVSLTATVTASLYPAWLAAKSNPADALRGT